MVVQKNRKIETHDGKYRKNGNFLSKTRKKKVRASILLFTITEKFSRAQLLIFTVHMRTDT